MQLIPKYANIKAAILPIGGNYTMDIEDCLLACDFIKCDRVVGVHYNTWPPIAIDTDMAIRKFSAVEKELLLPAIGETIEL